MEDEVTAETEERWEWRHNISKGKVGMTKETKGG